MPSACAASASFALSGIAAPALADGERDTARTYVQTNLVSDVPGLAAHTDPNLRNPWGTSTGPGLPIWVSDNATGVTTLYDGQGNLKEVAANQPAVMIPAPPSAGSGARRGTYRDNIQPDARWLRGFQKRHLRFE